MAYKVTSVVAYKVTSVCHAYKLISVCVCSMRISVCVYGYGYAQGAWSLRTGSLDGLCRLANLFYGDTVTCAHSYATLIPMCTPDSISTKVSSRATLMSYGTHGTRTVRDIWHTHSMAHSCSMPHMPHSHTVWHIKSLVVPHS